MDEPEKPFPKLRRLLPWAGVAILAIAIYDGSIFYSRWSRDRDADQARSQAEADSAKKVLDALGGDQLHIMNFYASPASIHPGAHADLCYGVVGAKKVQLQPPVDDVWPSLSRCIQVSPRKDTEYQLTAEDASGHSVSQNVVVHVIH